MFVPAPAPGASDPVRVLLRGGASVVHHGLAAILCDHPGLRLVHPVVDPDRQPAEVDVVLLDLDCHPDHPAHHEVPLRHVLRWGTAGLVVAAFSWRTEAEVVREALRAGVAGYLFKGLRAVELTASLESLARGTVVVRLGTPLHAVGTDLAAPAR